MGWSIGYDSNWKRDIGYGVPATCDSPGCGEEIDRGLGYVCGERPYGGDDGCGLFFCSKHRYADGRCWQCGIGEAPYTATPDVPRWINHKLTDESWQKWRDENPTDVETLRRAVNGTDHAKD